MKILLINQSHLRSGGANVVYLNTGRILEEHGHEVLYFAQQDKNNEPTIWSKYFYKAPQNRLEKFFYSFYNWRSKKCLKKLIKEVKPDLAHIHELGHVSDSILPVLKKNNIPVVMTVHDYHLVCPVSHFLNQHGKSCELCKDGNYFRCIKNACFQGSYSKSLTLTLLFYQRRWLYSTFKYYKGIVFVSHFSQDKNIEHDKRFKEIKHAVIYNSAQMPSTQNETNNEHYYLYFGRLSFEKGVDILIKAFAKMPQKKLVVVGTGALGAELKEYAKTSKNILFTGYKKGEELTRLISDAYYVVVPSICYENNPMAVVEAYSYGKPVIGAQSGAIPEFVKEGQTGFLFKKGSVDELISCVQRASAVSDDDYTKISKNARSFFEKNFSEDLYYSKLMDFYNTTLALNS